MGNKEKNIKAKSSVFLVIGHAFKGISFFAQGGKVVFLGIFFDI